MTSNEVKSSVVDASLTGDDVTLYKAEAAALLAKISAADSGVSLPLPSVVDDYCVRRFLVARKGDVAAAEKQLRKMLSWRGDNDIDTMLERPPPADAFALLAKVIPGCLHGTDKRGRPLYIERSGGVDVARLFNLVQPSDANYHHTYGVELMMKLCRESSARNETHIEKTTNVLDLAGMTKAHRRAMDALKDMSALEYVVQRHVTPLCVAPEHVPKFNDRVQCNTTVNRTILRRWERCTSSTRRGSLPPSGRLQNTLSTRRRGRRSSSSAAATNLVWSTTSAQKTFLSNTVARVSAASSTG
jgi:hypothetical protein